MRILRISLYSVRMREYTDQKSPNTNTFHAAIFTETITLFEIVFPKTNSAGDDWRNKLT